MKQSVKQISGFSLIELLVVMALFALAASLVGPVTIDQVEKMEARSELKLLRSEIRRLSFVASSRSMQVQLFLGQSRLQAWSTETESDESLGDSNYRWITFPHEQRIQLNRNGYPAPELLELAVREKTITLNLFRLVEGTE